MVAMSSKPKKPPQNAAGSQDVELLKSDVASFASSLGLSSSLPSSGFNDADFRRKGPLKPRDADSGSAGRGDDRKSKGKGKGGSGGARRDKSAADAEDDGPTRKPPPKAKHKPPVLSVDGNDGRRGVSSSFDKFRNLSKLPLVKASALGVWYVEAEELEAKVVGEKGKKLEVSSVDEWKAVVEEKRKLGERLMAQYAQDYESSRGQSGDVKMVVATQRSGTAADKVSAFSVMVGDNPIANLRSLDGLIGMLLRSSSLRQMDAIDFGFLGSTYAYLFCNFVLLYKLTSCTSWLLKFDVGFPFNLYKVLRMSSLVSSSKVVKFKMGKLSEFLSLDDLLAVQVECFRESYLSLGTISCCVEMVMDSIASCLV